MLALTLCHAAIFTCLTGLQFHAVRRQEAGHPSRFWFALYRLLTVAAISAFPVFLYLAISPAGPVSRTVAPRGVVAAAVIAAAGLARQRNYKFLTRWFRWCEFLAWCFFFVTSMGALGAWVLFRGVTLQ